MTYVENGTRFTHEYGDIDERFYSSVESALDELAALLRGEARGIYPQFSDRLAKVEQMADGIGWDFTILSETSSGSWRRNSAAGDCQCGRFTAPRARPYKTRSSPVIEHCYRDFLHQNYDPEQREYPDAADQIRKVLIHGNYMSQKDIEICLGFELTGLADWIEIDSIRTLHEVLISEYGPDNEHGAA